MLTLYSPAPHNEGAAHVLPFSVDDSPVGDLFTLATPTGDAWLLVEAIELAEWLGFRVVEAELDGTTSGIRWTRGRKQLWLDLFDSPSRRLATIAEAVRGEPQLAVAKMSSELAAYLVPLRAA